MNPKISTSQSLESVNMSPGLANEALQKWLRTLKWGDYQGYIHTGNRFFELFCRECTKCGSLGMAGPFPEGKGLRSKSLLWRQDCTRTACANQFRIYGNIRVSVCWGTRPNTERLLLEIPAISCGRPGGGKGSIYSWLSKANRASAHTMDPYIISWILLSLTLSYVTRAHCYVTTTPHSRLHLSSDNKIETTFSLPSTLHAWYQYLWSDKLGGAQIKSNKYLMSKGVWLQMGCFLWGGSHFFAKALLTFSCSGN